VVNVVPASRLDRTTSSSPRVMPVPDTPPRSPVDGDAGSPALSQPGLFTRPNSAAMIAMTTIVPNTAANSAPKARNAPAFSAAAGLPGLLLAIARDARWRPRRAAALRVTRRHARLRAILPSGSCVHRAS